MRAAKASRHRHGGSATPASEAQNAGPSLLKPGQPAILAFGNVRDMPWVVGGEIRVRKITQLAVSFDRRLVDGELGSSVLATPGRLLADPSGAFTLA